MTRLACVLLVVCACGGDDGSGGSRDVATEQLNNACPSTPTILTGTKPGGAACTSARECMPACCSCSTGGKQYLGAACIDGACVANACPETEPGFLCD
jgi:hypothetical protein